MTNYTTLKFFVFALAAAGLFFMSSCSDDDGGDAALDFEGQHAITSATDNASGADVLPLLEAALLADNACDTTISNNFPTLTLVNGTGTVTQGQLLNTCSNESLQEDGGTWLWDEPNNVFALSLIVDASPVPVPLQQTNVTITTNGNLVTVIEGDINLSGVIPGFPPSARLTTTRIP
jgi:hypothetical protein